MDELNGQESEIKTEPTAEVTEDYQKLLDYGIDEVVAKELDSIYRDGILCHSDLDVRALDALKEFNGEGGTAVLQEFRDSNLEHVSNKSAYLCGVMKTYRQKNKIHQGALPDSAAKKAGPDEAKIKEILDRTGYSLDVTVGQRKYGGPPPGVPETAEQPGAGHEVFCGKIPKEVFEDELIPLFEKCGKIWDLRLMMDPMTGLNRGYCFITFVHKEGAQEAVKQLDGFEIKSAKKIKVNVSVANLRLFVGNIPKSKTKEEIIEEFSKITENLMEVIIYSSADDAKKKNRGFAFLEYASHKDASVAKRKIGSGRTRIWGCDIIVDWADPLEEPDEETMAKVKVLYVRNLKLDVTEDQLKAKFEPYGKIERVKKIKDYGFVHYENRDDALQALRELNFSSIGDSQIEVSLAKPPSDSRQKQKQKRQQQMMMFNSRYDDGWNYGAPMGGPSPRRARGMGMRGGSRGMSYDPYDDGFYGGYGGGMGGYGGGDYYGNDYYEFDYDYGMGGGYRGRGGGAGRMINQYPQQMRGGMGAGMHGRGAARGTGGGRGAQGRGARGGMGGRGAASRGGSGRGNGYQGLGGGRGAAAGGTAKRKAGMDQLAGQSNKKRIMHDNNWGAQPIAQQPLGSDQEWYQDSFTSTWG